MLSAGVHREVTVRPHMPSFPQTATKSEPATKSGMGSPDWHVSVFDIHLRKLLWVYCPGHAGVKGNDSR